MLRLAQRLIKYEYNYTQQSIYAKNMPLQVQPKKLKTTFKEGQKPQYLYNAKIQFEEEYRPYRAVYSNGFLVSFVVVMAYLTFRYQRVRDLQGKTTTHEYAV